MDTFSVAARAGGTKGNTSANTTNRAKSAIWTDDDNLQPSLSRLLFMDSAPKLEMRMKEGCITLLTYGLRVEAVDSLLNMLRAFDTPAGGPPNACLQEPRLPFHGTGGHHVGDLGDIHRARDRRRRDGDADHRVLCHLHD